MAHGAGSWGALAELGSESVHVAGQGLHVAAYLWVGGHGGAVGIAGRWGTGSPIISSLILLCRVRDMFSARPRYGSSSRERRRTARVSRAAGSCRANSAVHT